MRCDCPDCGIYMVQREQGLKSGCVCPSCLGACTACMGGADAPVDADMLRALYGRRGGGEDKERGNANE